MTKTEMVEFIAKHEGFRKDVYIDPLQKSKFSASEVKWFEDNKDALNLTIGYGTLMEDIDDGLARVMLEYRLRQKIEEVNREFKYLNINHSEVWDMLYLMAYQLGVAGIKKFKKMLIAIEAKNHWETYQQALDSSWHKQTPNRAKEVVGMLLPLIGRV